MKMSLPSFEWISATSTSINTLLNNQNSAKNNYIFFIPNESEYSIRDGVLYDSDERVASVKD
jgi:hypothetical protein